MTLAAAHTSLAATHTSLTTCTIHVGLQHQIHTTMVPHAWSGLVDVCLALMSLARIVWKA